MQTRKYILVVAEPKSSTTDAAKALTGMEFRITVASSAEAALAFIEGNAQLSLVAVDAAIIEDPDDMLRRIRDRHRDLPVVWIRTEDDKRRFTVDPPNAVLIQPLDAATFETRAKALLFEDFFPRAVVHGLLSAGNSVLPLSCETAVEAGEPWLKQTEALEGNVHAYIAFMADGINGHLLTSGDIGVLAKLGERLGFDPDDGSRQVAIDMAGEIGNQVLGRMKSICGDLLKGVRMGVPVVWVGEGIHAHFSAKKPNLSVQLNSEDGPIFLNFGFLSLQSEDPNAGVPDDFMGAGELQFF